MNERMAKNQIYRWPSRSGISSIALPRRWSRGFGSGAVSRNDRLTVTVDANSCIRRARICAVHTRTEHNIALLCNK